MLFAGEAAPPSPAPPNVEVVEHGDTAGSGLDLHCGPSEACKGTADVLMPQPSCGEGSIVTKSRDKHLFGRCTLGSVSSAPCAGGQGFPSPAGEQLSAWEHGVPRWRAFGWPRPAGPSDLGSPLGGCVTLGP